MGRDGHEAAAWEALEPCLSQGQQRLEATSEVISAGQGPRKWTKAAASMRWLLGTSGPARGPWWERLTGAEAEKLGLCSDFCYTGFPHASLQPLFSLPGEVYMGPRGHAHLEPTLLILDHALGSGIWNP